MSTSQIHTGSTSRLRATRLTSDKETSRSSRTWVEVLPYQRSPETASEIEKADRIKIRTSIKQFIPYEPREAQVETLYHLIYGTSDVLLQAGTGYGKSLIFQLAGVLAKDLRNIDTSTLMISPLNSLTEQQIRNLENLGPCQNIHGVAITGSRNNSDKVYDEIGKGQYTHGMFFDFFEHISTLR